MFVYSKIYYMTYRPRGVGKLPIFDNYPLFIPIRILGPTALCINLHWIPGPLRFKLCSLLANVYNRTEPKEAFRISYLMLKNNPALQFALTSVRRYYFSNCMNIIEIPGESWKDLPLLSTTKFRARYLRKVS